MSDPVNKRVVIIGLDGATFDVIDTLRHEAKLPNLDSLMKDGVRAKLFSTIPPISAAAQVGMFTGKNPGKTGIYSFRNKFGEIINSTHIKCPTLWEIMEMYGKRSIIINVAATYPHKSGLATIVSGMLTPSGVPISNSQELNEFLAKMDYEVYLSDVESYSLFSRGKRQFLDRWTKIEEKRLVLAENYIKNTDDWSLLVLWFALPDPAHHFFGCSVDNEHIIRCYEAMDCFLGRLTSKLDEKTTVIIVSDHGQSPLSKTFNINVWLKRQGKLRVEKNWKTSIKSMLSKLHLTTSEIGRSLNQKRMLRRIQRILPLQFGETMRKITAEQLQISSQMDLNKSLAYGLSSIYGLIFVLNNSVIGDREIVVNEMKRKIEELVDESSGRKIFRKVFRANEVYNGPFTYDAPNLILAPSKGYGVSEAMFKKELFSSPVHKGTHGLEGIFIIKGGDTRRGEEIDEVSILDIAPTVLHILSIPIPSDMDGVVLKNCFDSESILSKRRVIYRETFEKERIRSRLQKLKSKYEL